MFNFIFIFFFKLPIYFNFLQAIVGDESLFIKKKRELKD